MTAPAIPEQPDPQTVERIQQLAKLIETIHLPQQGSLPPQTIRMFMPERVAAALDGLGVRVVKGYSNNDSQVAHQTATETPLGQG